MTTDGVTPKAGLPAYAKTIFAFLALLVSNAVASLMQSGEPWPTDGGQWARWGLTIVLGTLGVYGIPNTTTSSTVAATQSVRLRDHRTV